MSGTIEADVAAVGRIDAVPRILEVICRTTGMGFAAVARVTEDRWVACAVRDEIAFGLQPGAELDVVTTICDEVRGAGRAIVIDHVAQDALYSGHPTPAQYGFQSYISVPIWLHGVFFGTLCAIDPRPRLLTGTQVPAMFELFAELIAAHLDAEERIAGAEAALLSAHEASELREQLIAVLAHDLQGPLASIEGAARMIGRTNLDANARQWLGAMRHSARRMAGLIDDVLDLARSRLGGGFALQRAPTANLAATLREVVGDLRLAHPDRAIDVEVDISRPVHADERRIGQLLSNLLANALAHGDAGTPVRVRAKVDGPDLELSVANAGPPIPRESLGRLFRPFARSGSRPDGKGLGLGLYIAAEIARGHGGTLEAASADGETVFSFRMATSPAPVAAK